MTTIADLGMDEKTQAYMILMKASDKKLEGITPDQQKLLQESLAHVSTPITTTKNKLHLVVRKRFSPKTGENPSPGILDPELFNAPTAEQQGTFSGPGAQTSPVIKASDATGTVSKVSDSQGTVSKTSDVTSTVSRGSDATSTKKVRKSSYRPQFFAPADNSPAAPAQVNTRVPPAKISETIIRGDVEKNTNSKTELNTLRKAHKEETAETTSSKPTER